MAVYTQLSSAEISKILELYNIGKLITYQEITEGVENSNYLITTSENKYILTILEGRTDPTELPKFINLMEHLNNHNFPSPKVIKQKENEQSIISIHNKQGLIISFFEKNKACTEINPIIIKNLGITLAKLHSIKAPKNFNRRNALDLDGISNLALTIINEKKYDQYKAYYSEIKSNLKIIQQNYPKNLAKGIIHADLFPDNIFFEDNEVTGVIDLYFACEDILLYDLAIVINAWCFDDFAKKDKINKDKIVWNLNYNLLNELLFSYTKEYSKTNQIKSIDLNNLDLNILCLQASIRFLCTRIYDAINTKIDAKVKIKDPAEYYYKMQIFSQHIHNLLKIN